MRYEMQFPQETGVIEQLDSIQLNESERRQAKLALQQAEMIADAVAQLGADARQLLRFVGRGLSGLLRHLRPAGTRHVPH